MSTLQDKEVSEAPATATAPPPTLDDPSSADGKTLDHSTQMTCDVLCSLSMTAAAAQQGGSCPDDGGEEGENYCDGKLSCGGGMGDGAKLCPKQMLPMFLSKTYHMITLSDPTIACWSESGDNFVIKNVDKFSASILPRYFKHSNFSSFARQLNFYGFRKMRSDPILTSDVDPSTAGHVRFFHEKFQRDKPELLPHIKRATKTDHQSKDEIDTLRQEVSSLRDTLASTTAEYERRLAELSYDFNRRLSATTVEFDNFVALVQRTLTSHGVPFALPGPPGAGKGPDALHSLSQIATLHQDRGATGAAAIGHLQPPSAATGLGSLVGLSAKRPLDGTSPPAAPTRPRLG